MKIRRIYLIFISVVLLPVCLYFIFVSTNLLLPIRKEVPNSKGLASGIIREISKQMPAKDTLFMVLEKRYGVCGTGVNTLSRFSRKYDTLKDVLQHPYYINNEQSFDRIYNIKGKIILTGNTDTGPEGCGCFYSENINFRIDSTTKPKLRVLNLILKEGIAYVTLQDFDASKSIIKFNFILKDDIWHISK